MTKYNLFEDDGHMLEITVRNVAEEDLESYGRKKDIIYSDYDGTTQSGWTLVNEEEDRKYYAIKVK